MLIWLLLFTAITVVLLYFRAPLIIWTLAVGVALAAVTVAEIVGPVAAGVFWVLYIGVAAVLNVGAIRRRLISRRILAVLRKALPKISETEREALDAGTVWWDGELFTGRPDWNKLRSVPAARLSEEERAFLDGPVEELCRMLDDWQITHELNDLPPEVWQFLKDHKFFGMIIPKEYGGLEFSALAHSNVVMKVASRSLSAGVTVMVPNSLGPAELLLSYGTEEQKRHYLPRLAKGEEIPAFALTGPEAGSDAGAMPDTGVVCRGEFDGKKDVLGIRLNWEKRYITLGPVATVLGLAFKLEDPDHLLGEEESLGITLALIATDTPGISIGNRHLPLNHAFQNGPNRGKDVFIPMDWVIGGQARVGQGWRMLMESLAAGRGISLPSLSVGAIKVAARYTGGYARVRKQFKLPIARFEGIEEVLGHIAANAYLTDAARELTTTAIDQGEHPAVVTAIVKYQLTERMRRAVNEAMDIHGGSGICLGPSNFIGRGYQAQPIAITVEGANILTRSMIVFGQGAIRCHPYLLKEVNAAQNDDREAGLVEFDHVLFAHLGFTLSNLLRAPWLGLTNSRFVRAPHSPVRRYYQKLSQMSNAFALVTDFCLGFMGGSLKRREKISGRMADVLSNLYLISATLKRFEDQGNPREDLPLLEYACHDAFYEAHERLMEVLRNFPVPWVGSLLHFVIYPIGRRYARPRDHMTRHAAEILFKPSPARDRLTAGIYLSADPNDRMGRIEYAFLKVNEAAPAEKKIQSAIRDGRLDCRQVPDCLREAVEKSVVSAAEAAGVLKAIRATREAVRVDEFKPDLTRVEDKPWHLKTAGHPGGLSTS
jgi:acyl-CoA dehydrogenase